MELLVLIFRKDGWQALSDYLVAVLNISRLLLTPHIQKVIDKLCIHVGDMTGVVLV